MFTRFAPFWHLERAAAVVMLLLFAGSYFVSAAQLDPNCFKACPVGDDGNRVLRRTSHTLSNDAETKFATWVAYRVAPERIGKSRKRIWRADPELPADEKLEPSDFKGAYKTLGTDRGHQAPLATFGAMQEWASVNYLSNITPQKSALNQGPWKELEEAVRGLAKSNAGPVHVLTGPLYEREMPPLPNADEPHRVPSAYWKIIILAIPSIEVSGFVFDQMTPRRADFCDAAYAVAIGEIEGRSGLTFAPGNDRGGSESLRRRLGCSSRTAAHAAPHG